MKNISEKTKAIETHKMIIEMFTQMFNEHSKQGKPFIERRPYARAIQEQTQELERIKKLSENTPPNEIWDINKIVWNLSPEKR